MMRRVLGTPPAEKDLARLTPEDQRRILDALNRFCMTEAGDVRRLAATSLPEYRLRISPWRLRFYLSVEAVSVLRVLFRDKAYR
jgi:mRNA-degrading endonuclease RelE of RelBE toxin-antitoxin system